MCKGSRLQSHKRLMKQKGSTSERYVKTIQGSRYVLFIKKYRPLVPDSCSWLFSVLLLQGTCLKVLNSRSE